LIKAKNGTSSNTLSSGLAGYRMPAEWEPHEATWMAWPHFRGDWPGKFQPIPWVYAEIIRNLSAHERVELIVNDARSEQRALRTLKLANAFNRNVRFHRWPTNRVWTRDSGCTFVTGQAARTSGASHGRRRGSAPLRAIKWRFNAWAKYPNYRHDERIGSRMSEAAKADETRAYCGDVRVILEGGSIDVNGTGTLLTTEECLLSKVQERNPGFRRQDYEQIFANYLGIRQVLWLGKGIAGDDTHGHVDDITRFVSAETIVTMIESNRNDKNYQPLQENLRRLKSATGPDGKPFQIVELPMPAPVIFEGRRLPASYGNFYIANGIVLVPVFNDVNDRIALNTLADLFPTRNIIPIYSGDLIWGFGAMHCMTQQQPSVGG
jgi:agmatine deiminase